jgi:hypothetical protein
MSQDFFGLVERTRNDMNADEFADAPGSAWQRLLSCTQLCFRVCPGILKLKSFARKLFASVQNWFGQFGQER